MALIVEYHVIADMYPVGATEIKGGMPLEFDGSEGGTVIPCSAAGKNILGIAGDSRLDAEGQTTAYSTELLIGASGATSRFTSNRVSDFYNEAAASGKMTVYNGGGKFWISDDLVTEAAVIAGDTLTAQAAGTYVEGAGADAIIAIALGAAQAYSSGVPGTDTTDGSIALAGGDNNTWIPILLRI